MSTNLNNLEITYNKLYEISCQIGQLIERELYNDLIIYIDRKDKLLNDADTLVKKITETSENADRLDELCAKIQTQELSNIENMSKVRAEIKQKLHETTNSKKFVNAYSATSATSGNILDCRE